jgi:hypothetical protein
MINEKFIIFGMKLFNNNSLLIKQKNYNSKHAFFYSDRYYHIN